MAAPKVTGLSPKEGPPGTKVTVRGENLGQSSQDVKSLTIGGIECLLYVEWKSPSKIIVRATGGIEGGDVIVTTCSGGRGTCTVQFRYTKLSTGPTKELAVWVDESHMLRTSFGRNRSTSPSELHPNDPLELSDEANVGRFPVEELHDTFPDGSGNVLSENFVPMWYLLENHHGASFDDLKAGLTCLRRKVTQHQEGPLSFLKSNVMAIVECFQVLEALQSAQKKDKQEVGADLTEKLEEAVVKSKKEADSLFEAVLARKDRADGTRNALSALQRFKFLFNLPASIERNIQKGDYDVVINDYARAKSLFHNTEVAVFRKVYQEVEQRVEKFREMLNEHLKKLPAPVDEQKRLIRYLVNLEVAGDPAWDLMCYIYSWLEDSMNNCKDKHLILAHGEYKDNQNLNDDDLENDMPQVIMFVEEVVSLFETHFPDFWKLGQAYLNGELYSREVSDARDKKNVPKNTSFQRMTVNCTVKLCNMVRAALLSHTLKIQSIHENQSLGNWSRLQTTEVLVAWLPHSIRCIRECYSSLLKLDLPQEVLRLVQQLLFDLRVHSLTCLFTQAAEDVRNFDVRETWIVEMDDQNGGTTQLPLLFENRVIETLQLVREIVLQSGYQEQEVFSQINVQATLKQLTQSLLHAFVEALRKLANTDKKIEMNKEYLKGQPSVILEQGCDNNHQPPPIDQCLLIVTSNCIYTIKSVIPRLQECFIKHGYPDMSLVMKGAQTKFRDLEKTLSDTYLERKCGPLVGKIEPSMYVGQFDWTSLPQPTGVSLYVKETLMNMIEIHAEVFAVSPPFVSKVMTRIVEAVAEEMARLYECVHKFSPNGNVQAALDLRAMEEAVSTYRTNSTSKHFMKCRKFLEPFAATKDNKFVEEQLKIFKNHMRLQLLCFKEDEIITV
ncbi:exocyst complex component 2-like [Tachypleus tridentatus]|uniref:exocyst complex component 2-like n=1 Tax=Tachypleus tridentatus TaxID=6853 RepID=UPI003FD340AA